MEKNMNGAIDNKTYKTSVRSILVLFLIIQPILDLYMNMFDKYIQIAGVSLATILRFGVVFALLITVISHELKRKSTKIFIAYSVLVAVYIVAHHINAASFSVQLAVAKYSLVGELIYLARMCVPVALIYIIHVVKLSYKDIKRIVVFGSFMISFVIIISNLLEIGYMAYATDDIAISDSMISWFTGMNPDFHWTELSCRGLFQATNQLSGICMILCPILTYICFKERKIFYWITLTMHIIAMINLSTRAAVLGGIAIFCFIVAVYILEKIIHREVNLKKFVGCNSVGVILCLIIALVFFSVSPMLMRAGEGGIFDDILTNITDNNQPSQTETQASTETAETDSETDFETDAQTPSTETPSGSDDVVVREAMLKYVEENLYTAGLQELYFNEAYPYTEDVEFWYHIIKDVPEYERYGNRNMRGFLIDRILDRDNRVSNYIFGISYTRSSSFVWPERDIETHFDSLGVVGVMLFLGPYFVAVLSGIWSFFSKFKDNLYLKKCVYLIAAGIGIVVSYMSGHIMNEIFPAIYLAVVCGIVCNTCFGYDPEMPVDELSDGAEEGVLND